MTPKGILIAIGGNEEKEITEIEERFKADFEEGVILQEIIRHAGGPQSRIELITCASDIPGEMGDEYLDILMKLGAENAGNLLISDRDAAEDSDILKRIEDADVLLFTGGDQAQISEFLRGTRAHDLMADRYENEEVVIAGTSAGAVMMAEEMITGGNSEDILKKGNLKMGKGLGFVENVIFDSHYFQRGRFVRLAEATAIYPGKLCIGLGEDAGVIIREGNVCEVIGSGMVILLDGCNFDHNYYPTLKDDMPVSLVDLKVHILAPKDKYKIREKTVKIHNDPQYHRE